jgi:hypothetical protein
MHLVHQPAAASASAAAAAAAAGTSSGLVHGGALEAGLTLVAAQHLQQLPLKPPPQLPPQLLLQHPLAFHSQLTALTINHTAAKDGSVSSLLELCSQLRRLSLRGLLYNADSTVACLAASCRHLTALDLRHCSTLSGGWQPRLPAGIRAAAAAIRCTALAGCTSIRPVWAVALA